MPRKSDLPYVASANDGNVRADPVLPVEIYEFDDLSGTISTLSPFVLFEDVRGERGASETVCRILVNLSQDASIWFNMTGGNAGVRAPGSIELPAGADVMIPTRQRVSVIGTATGIPFTALEG